MRRSGGAELSSVAVCKRNWTVGATLGLGFQLEKATYIGYRSALPERLRTAVLRALRSADEPAQLMFTGGGSALDVHHVVAAGLERAAPGRLILRYWQVEVHSVANAAILPRSFHQGQGLHRTSFLEEVNRRVLAADGAARVAGARFGNSVGRRVFIDMLQKLGDSMVTGAGDAFAISLQAILRGGEQFRDERLPICAFAGERAIGQSYRDIRPLARGVNDCRAASRGLENRRMPMRSLSGNRAHMRAVGDRRISGFAFVDRRAPALDV